MKYKKLHQLSTPELQVLRDISRRTPYSVFDVQSAYAYWNLNVKVEKMLEREFEMAFLSGKSAINSGHVHQKKAHTSLVLQSHIRGSLQYTKGSLQKSHKPERDLVINNDDITNLRIELNRADISLEEFLERV